MPDVKVSIVTSLYRSAPYIREFHARCLAAVRTIEVEYEFVYVNDGSPDDSRAIVESLIREDPKVILVDLSRNFGQYPAMVAGMAHATGDLIYICDSDLEEPPERIVDFFTKLHAEPDADVVYGVVGQPTGGLGRNLLRRAFYIALDLLSEHRIPRNQAWARLMTRRYVEQLLSFPEVETMPAGLMHLAGFHQIPVVIEKEYKGHTTYSLFKRLRLAVSSITSFSSRPMVYISMLGLGMFSSSTVIIAWVLFRKLFIVDYQAGWTSLIASIWCVGGLIIFCVGTMGIYIAKIFEQVKNRPLYIVKDVVRDA